VQSDDDGPFFNLGEGCSVHGDSDMRECRTCGTEFCGRCFPDSAVCPDCEAGAGDEEDDDPRGKFGDADDDESEDAGEDEEPAPDDAEDGDDDAR